MGDFDLDPELTRELARVVRGHADATAQLTPLTQGLRAEPTLPKSDIAATIDSLSGALEKVIDYHTRQLRGFADSADAAVEAFLAQDAEFASRLKQAGQK
ncbi:hypothetical protein [Nocardia beijingensis]|uniref:PE domain-containing protein n=1 Tax=Nocardia beijingensis TaxID=95162 RepID=A0ABW7WJJ6_9NOCA